MYTYLLWIMVNNPHTNSSAEALMLKTKAKSHIFSIRKGLTHDRQVRFLRGSGHRGGKERKNQPLSMSLWFWGDRISEGCLPIPSVPKQSEDWRKGRRVLDNWFTLRNGYAISPPTWGAAIKQSDVARRRGTWWLSLLKCPWV